MVGKDDSPEDILSNFLSLTNTSSYVTMKKVQEIFSTQGKNRVTSVKDVESFVDSSHDISKDLNLELAKNTVKKIMSTVSLLVSPIKRKALVAYFFTTGIAMQYQDVFHLNTRTSDPQKNIDNERLNKQIQTLTEILIADTEDSFQSYYKFIRENYPDYVYNELITKHEGYLQETTTGNIYALVGKLLWDNGVVWKLGHKTKFMEATREFRLSLDRYTSPTAKYVCEHFEISESAYRNAYKEALGVILKSYPDELLKNVIEGGANV